MENGLGKEGIGLAQGWRGQSHGIREAWQQEFAHIRVDHEAESKLEARPGYKPKARPQGSPPE